MSVSTSLFLELPAELRNRIYRCALLNGSKYISLQLPLPREPGLLRVNRQIREESKSIYLRETEFHIRADNFDPTALIKWSRKSKHHFKSRVQIRVSRSANGSGMWYNVIAWVEAVFREETLWRLNQAGARNPEVLIAAKVLDAATRMKGKNMDWEDIKDSLDEMRQIAALGNGDYWMLA